MVQAFRAAPAPRWVIFAIDMLIIMAVACIIFIFPTEFFGASYKARPLAYCVTVGMYAVMNLLTGSYRCIIRLSVPHDLLKVFWCVMLASVATVLASLVYSLLMPDHFLMIGIVTVAVIAAMAMSLMMSLRICVKYFYAHLTNLETMRENAVILGSNFAALAIATMLREEADGKYMPVAFLSLHGRPNGRKINGLPVDNFQTEKVEDIFRRRGAVTLICPSSRLDELRTIAEPFINAHIKIRLLNQVENVDLDTDADQQPSKISGHINDVRIEDLLGRPVIKNDNPLIHDMIQGETVLITGAAGSIGSEIVRQVADFGAGCIVLLDQAETPMHDMQLEMEANHPETKIVLYMADVQNKERLEQAFRRFRPKYVFHAAAYKHVPMMERNPTEAILTNVMGTKNLADLSLQHGVRKFVMISTDKAVNPTNVMGASKRIAEIYVQSLFFRAARGADGGQVPQFITTRFGNVLGSNGSVIPLFRRQIAAGGPVTVTHRDIIRYFMTIQEACSLVLEAGCMGRGGEIFLFDMGQPMKIYDLATRMINLAGLKPGKDIKIVETGLRPGEKLFEELLNDKEKTIPTGNQKIMRAKVREYDFTAIAPHIEAMIRLAREGQIHDMVMTMKGLVPEYISNNSEFQQIDREIREKKTPHTRPSVEPSAN